MTTTILPDWAVIAERLRSRDDDPAFAGAPVLDAYARISRNPDSGVMEKTDSQLCDILREIERRGARLGAILRDDNLSAWKKNGKRPDWKALVRRLEARENNGVICWHVDRLMRQMADLEKLIKFGDRGFIVGSCFGEYDLGSSDDRFTLRVLTAAAEKEGDNISRRTKAKNERRRMAGYVGTGGFRAFGFAGKDVDPETVKRERDAVEWGIKAHIDGKSLSAIAREWNSRGLRSTRTGTIFGVVRVRAILARARNAALVEHNRELVKDGSGEYLRAVDVDPIVSVDDLLTLRAVLASRSKGRPASSQNYPLSGGVLRCATCGNPMVGNKNPHGTVYRCPPRMEKQCPRPVSINAANANATVREWVLKRLSDPRHADVVARKSAALARVDAEIEKASQTARELSERLGKGEIPFDRYDAAIRPLDARIARLTAERDALIAAGAGQRVDPQDVAELSATWDGASADGQRRMALRAFPLGIAVIPAAKRRGPASERLKPVTEN